MKHILLTLLLLSPLAFAEENSMVPLSEFFEKLGNDASAPDMLYVEYRCIGYYTNLLGLFLADGSDRTSDVIKDIEMVLETFDGFAWKTWVLIDLIAGKEDSSYEEYFANLKKSLGEITKNYQIESNNSWNNSGSYFNDYLNNDGAACIEMTQVLENMFNKK